MIQGGSTCWKACGPCLCKEGFRKERESFDKLAPSHKRLFVRWVSSAKRKETRRKRLAEAITLLERGEKSGMK